MAAKFSAEDYLLIPYASIYVYLWLFCDELQKYWERKMDN